MPAARVGLHRSRADPAQNLEGSGSLHPNGVPYSGDAALTEYFARLVDDDGTEYLAVTQMLEDPIYLAQPVVRTMLFKKSGTRPGGIPLPARLASPRKPKNAFSDPRI